MNKKPVYDLAKTKITEEVLSVLTSQDTPKAQPQIKANSLSEDSIKSISDMLSEKPSSKYSDEDFAKFNKVMLPGGEREVGEKTGGSLLPANKMELISPHRYKKVNEQYEQFKESQKPKDYSKLKTFQKDLDAIEYLDKKYSSDVTEYDPEDEKQLTNLINRRNTLTGIHTGLTFGELEDYKLFNAAKKINEQKGKSGYQKDLKKCRNIFIPGPYAIILTTGGDFESTVKSGIRKEITNQDIEGEYKKEVQPHSFSVK
jgi:hypothetical protein